MVSLPPWTSVQTRSHPTVYVVLFHKCEHKVALADLHKRRFSAHLLIPKASSSLGFETQKKENKALVKTNVELQLDLVEASFWAVWVERSKGQASRGRLVGGEGALPKGCPVRRGGAGLGFTLPGEIPGARFRHTW